MTEIIRVKYVIAFTVIQLMFVLNHGNDHNNYYNQNYCQKEHQLFYAFWENGALKTVYTPSDRISF